VLRLRERKKRRQFMLPHLHLLHRKVQKSKEIKLINPKKKIKQLIPKKDHNNLLKKIAIQQRKPRQLFHVHPVQKSLTQKRLCKATPIVNINKREK
jgi:hypothetical protein